MNALASIAIATELGVDDASIARALQQFQGVGRRFQMLGEKQFEGGSAIVIDDYGHHPREVAVTIQAARQSWPERRLVMVFQPHRYTRTHDLFSEFRQVLSQVDALVLLDVYSAGEPPIPGADSVSLLKAIQEQCGLAPILVDQHQNLASLLQDLLRDGDVLLMQGAGNIGALASHLAATDLKESTQQVAFS